MHFKSVLLLLSVGATNAFLAVSPMGMRSPATRAQQAPLAVYMDAALIVQNKGGGHGEIGFHLARQLRSKGLDVTLLQDSAAKMDKLPFKHYGEIEAEGVEIISCNLEDSSRILASLSGKKFTHVFDNYAKDEKTVSTVAGLAKNTWKVKNYAYVSSAGMYESSVPQPMVETAATKATGQRAVEEFLASNELPWTSFRPQYIYGPYTNKRDYLDWFFHRIMRDRPCPLPGNGNQMASVTRVEDVASMLASVVGKEDAAKGQVFNCGTDSMVSYRQICEMIGQVVGKTAKVVTYNPKSFELPKGAFPFRNTEFCVTPEKAKNVLGWARKHSLAEDLPWYFESYKAAGLDSKAMEFEADEIILGATV